MKPEKKQGVTMGAGIAIGIAIGAGLGVAFDNLALGMGAGIAIGAGLGAASGIYKNAADKDKTGKSEEPRDRL